MVAHSRCPGSPRTARIMFLILACMLAVAVAAPATYDQQQDGEFNVRADVQNVVILVAIPQKLSLPMEILSGLLKSRHNSPDVAQDRADVQVMEAFVEPSTPYRVEIGTEGSERSVEGDGRAVEVVIAGRKRSEGEPQPERDELKLLGALEQCGPERERDPVSLRCLPQSQAVPEETPEVILASS